MGNDKVSFPFDYDMADMLVSKQTNTHAPVERYKEISVTSQGEGLEMSME